ncbi:hypothetical protein BVRB_4g087400 [Beta vulgaris subsp. vulgaris]|nr:hypothetical protein BVRB_4g087400 [Beta vulgaris subsp. vulgaris]
MIELFFKGKMTELYGIQYTNCMQNFVNIDVILSNFIGYINALYSTIIPLGLEK